MRPTLTTLIGCLILCSLPLQARQARRTPPAAAKPSPQTPAPAPPRREEKPTPFKVGEALTFDVSWSSFLTAGTVVATVMEKKPSYNSIAYYIVAEGRPTALVSTLYTLYYKVDTLIDAYTLLSQRGSIYSEEGKRHRLKTTVFNRDTKKASFEYRTDTVVKNEFPVSPYVQDALSALYVMRAISLKAGDRITMPVSDSGNDYRVVFDISAPEAVKVPFGSVNAWKLKVALNDAQNQTVGRNLALWLSSDARQLPVKMQADLPVGSFVLSLREAR